MDRMGSRSAFAWCLSLLVALSGISMAAARAAPAPVGQMVICSGQGFAVVLVDVDGQPTRAAHLCPDCAFASAAGLPDAARVLRPAANRAMRHARLAPFRVTTAPRAAARARAPPSV